MIKRFAQLTGATLALFAGAIAAAQAPRQTTAVDTASPAMWRVADADSEFILLGTFHILPPALEWRTDALDAAMKNADAVYFEVEADTPEAQSKTVSILMTQGFNPPGVTLSSMLSDDDTQKLKDITRSLGLPFSAVEPMRPWQAFLTLSVQFIVKQGFQPGAGVDSVLLAESRTLGKELRFLETLEQQLNLFTTLEPDTEKNLLVLTLQDWENQQEMFDDLFAAWARGDAAFIDDIMNDTMREQTPKVYERLIVQRNQAWADEIANAMNNSAGTALVAVGAGHLVGDEHSVPALLKARGFDVSRYSGDGEKNVANDNTPDDGADEIEGLLKQMETPE